MRLVSFGASGLEQAGIETAAGIVPVAELDPNAPTAVRELLQAGSLGSLAKRLTDYAGPWVAADQVRLGPPITDPSKIICIGLNYRGHAEEQGVAWPAEPLLFAKAPSSISGCRDPIELPLSDACVDYEVELAVVIGRKLRRCSPAEALDAIAGYMVADDVSARRWQKHDGQWFRAKSCDSFYPCGPALVTADEIPDPAALRLSTRIGDDLLQDACADELIHDIPALLVHITRDMTLLPGDIVSTGTPAGVGCYREPKRFLQPGDVVTCSISGIGDLVNPVVAGAAG